MSPQERTIEVHKGDRPNPYLTTLFWLASVGSALGLFIIITNGGSRSGNPGLLPLGAILFGFGAFTLALALLGAAIIWNAQNVPAAKSRSQKGPGEQV